MKKWCVFSFFTFLFLSFSPRCHAQGETFGMRQLACGLSQPWEIKFGPDGWLWVTEAHSYQITRVDPATGTTELLVDLSARKNFPNFSQATTWPQGGLQGLAFHPNFNSNPYVYVAYVYQFNGCLSGTGGCYFRTKIVRYNYDMGTKTLSNEKVVIDTIPGSSDHNGGRLVTGSFAAGMGYLFYSVGDMAAGHLGNGSRPHHGQNPGFYEGKILRFNLTTDGDTGIYDAWIPNDNPFNTPTRQSAVWSLGHRNPQGLVVAPDGTLYESEHGPYSDDEINIIRPGYNYGFPLIMGYADGNYDGSRAGAGPGAPAVTSELTNQTAIQQLYPYSDPIKSLFAATKAEVTTLYGNDVNNTPPFNNYYLYYPTSAPSGIDYYGADAIPGWKGSLLVANLKLANVYRLKLSANGSTVVGDTIVYFQGLGRFRDIAISPDGSRIYVAADSEGSVRAAQGIAGVPPNKGCILEFSYVPTGISQTAGPKDFRIYPNPASGMVHLELPAGLKMAEVAVYNMVGERVQTKQVTSRQPDLSIQGLPPGIYMVALSGEGVSRKERLVIR